ncbi:MAG: adenosylcobinamide amidohydrolase [Acidimicrobiales bacterium]
MSKPTWAADPDGGYTPWSPGTINLVIEVPVALSRSAAVNVVITATEAKTQALFEAGVPGTGTASDAIVVIWSESGPTEDFAGPARSGVARGHSPCTMP